MSTHVPLLIDRRLLQPRSPKEAEDFTRQFPNSHSREQMCEGAMLEYFRTVEGQVRRFNLEKAGETGSFNLDPQA